MRVEDIPEDKPILICRLYSSISLDQVRATHTHMPCVGCSKPVIIDTTQSRPLLRDGATVLCDYCGNQLAEEAPEKIEGVRWARDYQPEQDNDPSN